MTAFIVIVWALIGFVAGVISFEIIAELTGASNMEGRLAIPGLFAGLLGALGGVFLGLALLRKFEADERKRRLFAGLSFAGIFVIPLGIYLFETIRTHDRLDSYGGTWNLTYDVRLPAAARAPEKMSDVVMELRSPKETSTATMSDGYWLRRQGDRLVIQGYIDLRYATSKRTIAVRVGSGPTQLFKVRIAARPHSATMSKWFPVDEIDDNAPDGKPRAPRPDEKYEIRYAAR